MSICRLLSKNDSINTQVSPTPTGVGVFMPSET